jgi:hypothetical protein
MIEIMGFQSRELDITCTERAVAWTCNISSSSVQSALECEYENSLTCGRLSELSGDKYHTMMTQVGEKIQRNQAENRIELRHD